MSVGIAVAATLFDDFFELSQRLSELRHFQSARIKNGDGNAFFGDLPGAFRHWATLAGFSQILLKNGIDQGAFAETGPTGD